MREVRVKFGVNVFYHKEPGPLPSGTTAQAPHFLRYPPYWLRKILSHFRIDYCRECSADGWDADWGGVFVCPKCRGRGIKRYNEEEWKKVIE